MALPSSGNPISMSMVRTELSQSAMQNYSLAYSLAGYGSWCDADFVYAPVNVLGSNFWSEDNPIQYGQNNSMSIWYSYNHTSYSLNTDTASLYAHSAGLCYTKTMAIIDAGTTDRYIDIHLSGSVLNGGTIDVHYGKPWKNNGIAGTYPACTSSLSTLITQSLGVFDINTVYNFYYQYDANYGQYLYITMTTGCY